MSGIEGQPIPQESLPKMEDITGKKMLGRYLEGKESGSVGFRALGYLLEELTAKNEIDKLILARGNDALNIFPTPISPELNQAQLRLAVIGGIRRTEEFGKDRDEYISATNEALSVISIYRNEVLSKKVDEVNRLGYGTRGFRMASSKMDSKEGIFEINKTTLDNVIHDVSEIIKPPDKANPLGVPNLIEGYKQNPDLYGSPFRLPGLLM